MAKPLPHGKLDVNTILYMRAGRELDALVAREVMGYHVECEEGDAGSGEDRWTYFVRASDDRRAGTAISEYSTKMEAAWRVAKKMESRGDTLSLQCHNPVEDDPGVIVWTAGFRRASRFVSARTPALAICRAALLALAGIEVPPRKSVNIDFFAAVERELKKVMGPIAPIILEEKLTEFEETRASFPEDRVQPFVQAISEEITEDSKRALFLRAMAGFVAGKKSHVNAHFFASVERELKKVMGPIAPIILEDKLAEFGESRESFPEHRVRPFVQAISEEITENSKRALFVRAMAGFLLEKRY